MSYFILDGIDSRDFGIYLYNEGVGTDTSILPSKRSSTFQVAGEGGSKLSEQLYNERTISLNCYTKFNDSLSIKQISSWVSKLGNRELIISDDDYKKYIGNFENEVTFERQPNITKFKLKFKMYSPLAQSVYSTLELKDNLLYNNQFIYNSGYRYSDLGGDTYIQENITSDTDIEIYNGSNTDGSLPNIIINGSATDITITHYKSSSRTEIESQLSYGIFSGELELNCRIRNVFLDSNVNNETFDGKYFELLGKNDWTQILSSNIVSYSGDQVVLNEYASDVDDFYNGYLIFIRYDEDVYNFSILDYDGTTKTLTLSDSLPDNLKGDSIGFTMYERPDGMNYFTISGTNLDLTKVQWDFNYVYL